eukprot:3497196-Prymnesium_polylepis.1
MGEVVSHPFARCAREYPSSAPHLVRPVSLHMQSDRAAPAIKPYTATTESYTSLVSSRHFAAPPPSLVTRSSLRGRSCPRTSTGTGTTRRAAAARRRRAA